MQPTTMYGCNKLYCEQLGTYYARHYKQLAAERPSGRVDFRCVRFPGLISALTTPSGGTSDYAPEMIHAAAKGQRLQLFRPAGHADPVHGDAGRRRGVADAGRGAARAPDAHGLQRRGLQARRREEIRNVVLGAFPSATIDWARPTPSASGIVDSWPADVDDAAARRDWGFDPLARFRTRVRRLPDSADQGRYDR